MMHYLSPAKINLFLRVLDKRSDGYHNIASLIQAIDLYDNLHIALADAERLTCSDPSIPTDSTNLILKAADLFKRKTGLKFSINVHLEKNIPSQAGLGGGSSNAATTLWALNELHGKPASLQDLARWSSEIGSDIAFFFSQGTAYCTGRGEILHPLPSLPKHALWILKPVFGLSTPLVYRHFQPEKPQKRDPEVILKQFQAGEWPCFNDLEEPAFSLSHELFSIKQQLLNKGYLGVTMTGSGTALFCMGKERPNVVPYVQHVEFAHRQPDCWWR